MGTDLLKPRHDTSLAVDTPIHVGHVHHHSSHTNLHGCWQ